MPGEPGRTAEGLVHAEATQRSEVYLGARCVALDRVNFIPGEIYFFFPPTERFAELSSEMRDHNKSISFRGVILSTQFDL